MVLLLALLIGVSQLSGQDDPTQLLQSAQADLHAGRNAPALEKARKAAQGFQSAANRKDYVRAQIAVGSAELYSGAFDAAIHDFEAGLKVSRDLADLGNEVRILNNISSALYYQGRYGDAMERYQQALKRIEAAPNDQWSNWGRQITQANIAVLFQTLGQPERALTLYTELLRHVDTMPPEEHAQFLTNVGVLRRRLGNPRKALETYRSAQELYKKAAHRDGEIGLLNDIGIVQAMDLQDYPAAEATFTTAYRLAEQSGDRPLAVHSRLYRGETFFRAGRVREAQADFQFAAAKAHDLGAQEEEWKALYGLARVALASGDTKTAKDQLTQAVDLIEALRTKAGSFPALAGFLVDKRAVYDLLIENTTAIKDVFALMEKSRARALRDRRKLNAPTTLAAAARSLPNETAVLEFWMGESSALVIWITASQSGIKRWAIDNSDQKLLEDLLAALSDPRREDWKALAQQAAPKLLAGIPVLDDPRIRKLIVVPDGKLARIPFEALPRNDEPLVRRFSISYLPTAALLRPTNAAQTTRFLWPWQQTLEGFGDPAPGPVSSSGVLADRQWPGLPEASRELRGIGELSGGRYNLNLGTNALKQRITGAAPALHFATHGFADQQNPELSFLLLAPASPAQQYDYLFLKEVYALPLSGVNLVTLSACETEVGKFMPGEGAESFSQAFLSAGATGVVSSLWRVGDKSAAEFMLRLYRKLWSGENLSDALQAVKIEFLKSPSAAHPAHWSAFVGYGDGGVRLPRVIRWSWLGGMAAASIAAALFLLTRRRAP